MKLNPNEQITVDFIKMKKRIKELESLLFKSFIFHNPQTRHLKQTDFEELKTVLDPAYQEYLDKLEKM